MPFTPENRAARDPVLPTSDKPARTGRLKIFAGACPGVGKTRAMLNAARELQHQQGVRVLAGLVDAHRQPEIEALVGSFEILPPRDINSHNHVLREFDLDEALLKRPGLILIDELVHTNAPGSRHKRRYQDVAELLSAGIDVYTTFDILHLESLNDLVLQITGIQVRETVPDKFIDDADELIFVDLTVTTLIDRLKQGRIHLPEYAQHDPHRFFTPEKLTALRELAMREVMNRVDKRLEAEQTARTPVADYIINDRLLVLISNNADHEYLIRAGRQIADRRRIEWMVVWVDTGRPVMREDRARLQSALALAAELGAHTEVLRGYDTYLTIIPFVNVHRINTVLVGAGTRQVLNPWRKRLFQRLIESGLPLEVTVCRPPARSGGQRLVTKASQTFAGSLSEHLFGLFVAAVATVFAILLDRVLNSGNLVLIYVLGVILVGLKHGAGPAITTVFFSFLSFDFFHTEPIYKFFPIENDDIATIVFLVGIALLCGPAASLLRRQFILLNESNRYTEALRLLGQKLTVADTTRSVWQTLAGELGRTLPAEVCILVSNEGEENQFNYPGPTSPFTQIDRDAIEWSKKFAGPAGRFTDTLSAAAWTMFPLSKEGNCIAVAAIRFGVEMTALKPYDKDLITAMLQQASDAWQRIQLTSRLESAHLKTEVEQIRSALLSSVSHDLKSPLAAMIGAAEMLNLRNNQLEMADQEELTDTILQESRRLESYIQNLLDMTRLGHGTLNINRDWVSVDDIVGAALARLKRYFPEIATEYHPVEPEPLLYAQAMLIEQALYNILENAAKFTPPGEKIRIWVEQYDNVCFISIEDKGPGIPEPLREKIFDMFYAVAAGDHKNQNTGMGLAICRGMIGAHGGKVEVHSGRDNTGTRFVIELPTDRSITARQI